MGMEKELRVLNRKIVWHDGEGLTLEADQRHAEMLVAEFANGLGTLKTHVVPEPSEGDDAKEQEALKNNRTNHKEDSDDDDDDETRGQRGDLESSLITNYRSAVARAFLCID